MEVLLVILFLGIVLFSLNALRSSFNAETVILKKQISQVQVPKPAVCYFLLVKYQKTFLHLVVDKITYDLLKEQDKVTIYFDPKELNKKRIKVTKVIHEKTSFTVLRTVLPNASTTKLKLVV